MLLPIGHDESTVRRLPIVTIAIVALCFVCFILELIATSGAKARAAESLQQALAYHSGHPYLHAKPPLTELIDDEPAPPPGTVRRDVDPRSIADEQAYLDGLTDRAAAALDALPVRRFGYVPARGDVVTLVTHAFLHGGWLHLIFNMWFLWLCGVNLEDRWGRGVFAAFYLTGAIAGALAHKLAEPASTVPMIGASGAIAAAMGAFLVTYAKTRIRFFYFWFIRFGTFSAPAWVMLPLWFLEQIVGGILGASDVAYFAHVGGFVYGVAIAVGLRLTGIDRWLDLGVELQASEEPAPLALPTSPPPPYGASAGATPSAPPMPMMRAPPTASLPPAAVPSRPPAGGGSLRPPGGSLRPPSMSDPRAAAALALVGAGRAREAIAQLDALIAAEPTNVAALKAMLEASRAAAERNREAATYARLVRVYFDASMTRAALDAFQEAQTHGLERRLAAAARLRVADELRAALRTIEADAVYASIEADDGGDDAARTRATVARAGIAALAGDRVRARRMLEAARPPTPELAELVERELLRLGT